MECHHTKWQAGHHAPNCHLPSQDRPRVYDQLEKHAGHHRRKHPNKLKRGSCSFRREDVGCRTMVSPEDILLHTEYSGNGIHDAQAVSKHYPDVVLRQEADEDT